MRSFGQSDLRMGYSVFRHGNRFPAIPPDVLKERGFIAPAKTAARAITNVCRKEAYDYVVVKMYPNIAPKQQLQTSIPIKRALGRLGREMRLVHGDQ